MQYQHAQTQPYTAKSRYFFIGVGLVLLYVTSPLLALILDYEMPYNDSGLKHAILTAVIISLGCYFVGRNLYEHARAAVTRLEGSRKTVSAKPVKPIVFMRKPRDYSASLWVKIILFPLYVIGAPMSLGRWQSSRALARAGGDPKQMWCVRRRMNIDGVERNVRVLLWQAQAPEWASNRLAEAVLSPCGQYLMTADAFEVFYGRGSLEERRETFRRNFEEKASRPELAAGLALPVQSGIPTMLILAFVAFMVYMLYMQFTLSYNASLPIGEQVCEVLKYSWTIVLILGMYLFFGFKNFRAWRARRAASRR